MSPDQQNKFRVVQSRNKKFTRLAPIPSPSKPRLRLIKPVRLSPNELVLDRWKKHLERSKSWRIHITHELLHSEAYKKLNYGPAVKVLNWFYEKIPLAKVVKRKRGAPLYRMLDDPISFTYVEAELRGLTHQKFARAIRELHRLGFIDVTKPGSRLKGDWTAFKMSERWRDFGTTNFKSIEFSRSVHWTNFGFRKK